MIVIFDPSVHDFIVTCVFQDTSGVSESCLMLVYPLSTVAHAIFMIYKFFFAVCQYVLDSLASPDLTHGSGIDQHKENAGHKTSQKSLRVHFPLLSRYIQDVLVYQGQIQPVDLYACED